MQDPRQAAEKRVGSLLNGKWQIDRLLDIGGMAAVYAATHRNGKRVAVKMLHTELSAEPQIKERFLREGYVANKVEHPGAVQILDDDTTPDGGVFLVMELLEGESLDAYLKRIGGTLRFIEVLAIADQVLAVLDVAHKKGIVHRDIKPANLFLSKEGHVKVLDFGLARIRDGKMTSAPTAMGTILGTYQYMPPEQARGKTNLIDARTDLWAVGAVMFRALTGRYVHAGDAAHQILMHAMTDRAPLVQTLAPEVPKVLAEVVDRALAFEMDARFPDAASMQNAVRVAFETLRREGVVEPPTVRSVEHPQGEPASVVVEVSFGGHEPLPAEVLEEISVVMDEPGERLTQPSPGIAPRPPPLPKKGSAV